MIQRSVYSIILVLFLIFPVFAQDYQPIPPLEKRVTDLIGLLSSGESNAIEQKLAQFEQEKGSQIVVLIMSTTKPEEIEQYSIRLAEDWKVGREGVDDGIILLVAKDDRKLRIEVGYGLEGAVPDAYSKRIIEQIILPQFRDGDFYHGIDSGVDALIALVSGEELPVPDNVSANQDSGGSILTLFMIIMFFVVAALGSFVRKKVGKFGGFMIMFAIVFLLGWLFMDLVSGLIAAVFVSIFSSVPGRGGRGGRGGYYVGGGGWSSGGGGFSGGGFSGGGGSFGGGGSSGSW